MSPNSSGTNSGLFGEILDHRFHIGAILFRTNFQKIHIGEFFLGKPVEMDRGVVYCEKTQSGRIE